jgi:hypothetical protein
MLSGSVLLVSHPRSASEKGREAMDIFAGPDRNRNIIIAVVVVVIIIAIIYFYTSGGRVPGL